MSFVLTRNQANTHFQHIHIGSGVVASIQAGSFHYCTPREDNLTSDQYTHFEVALFLNNNWYHPEQDTRFIGCEWIRYWSQADDVAANVPRNSVEQMLKDLGRVFGN
jgi:hypothetical protein